MNSDTLFRLYGPVRGARRSVRSKRCSGPWQLPPCISREQRGRPDFLRL